MVEAMTNLAIDAAVAVAFAARTPDEVEAAKRLLGAVTADIPEPEWPDRCPEVLAAFEQLETVSAEPSLA